MSNPVQKVYPKGIIAFAKNDRAPEWVVGSMVINPNALFEWLSGKGNQYLTDYNGNAQLNLHIAHTKDGKLSVAVDTWKPENKKPAEPY